MKTDEFFGKPAPVRAMFQKLISETVSPGGSVSRIKGGKDIGCRPIATAKKNISSPFQEPFF